MRRSLIFLLILVALFCGVSDAQMFPGPGVKGYAATGIALVSGSIACAGGTNSGTTIAANASAANFAIISIGVQPIVTLTVSDSNSNTWTALTRTGGTPNQNLYYSKNFAGTASHTFTVSATAGFVQFKVLLFSGLTTSAPFDKETTGESASGPTFTPGALTPTSADSLFVTGYGTDGTQAASSVDSGFTMDGACGGDGATKYGVGVAHFIQTGGPTSKSPTWTFSSNTSIGKNSVFK